MWVFVRPIRPNVKSLSASLIKREETGRSVQDACTFPIRLFVISSRSGTFDAVRCPAKEFQKVPESLRNYQVFANETASIKNDGLCMECVNTQQSGEPSLIEPENSAARHQRESRAQLILEVSKAVNSHLDLAQVLDAVAVALNPKIHFNAVAVTVIERDQARLYSVHLEGLDTKPGESIESVAARAQRARHIDRKPGPLSQPLQDTWISEFTHTRRPYVCTDLRTQRRFRQEEELFDAGGENYISLPLIKHHGTICARSVISLQKNEFTSRHPPPP